ncbi:hypothetical protein IFR05_011017 [Cadophora sp. M221]|nr:hypothetical protein IFR05_011017 [Cadophora sp. M221]
MSSDIDHWHIDATVFKDRVEEIHFISDPARNVRRQQHRKIWEVERFLGRGGFGEVRLERNKEDGKARAVKKIATTSVTLSNSELFVDFFGWFKDGSDVFLAMEYVSLGDLEKNVIANSGKIPESEARSIAEQILSGLEIMHAESFAHRDLKPQNVLVVNGPPSWWIKLADFGLSKRLTDTTAFYTKSGTQSYMAPEILNYLNGQDSSDQYTNSVDIWALGCIVYRLITGTVPFPLGKSLIKYCEDKSLFPYDALFDSGIKSECSKFLRQLLTAQPTDRPAASQALQHPWILTGHTFRRSSLKVLTPAVEILSQLTDVELMEGHLERLDSDSSFRHGLRRTLQNPIRIDDLLLQCPQSKDLVRKYLNDQAISRLILDPPGLRRGIDKLQSGSNADVYPLTLVLEFLKTAVIRQMSAPRRNVFSEPRPGHEPVQSLRTLQDLKPPSSESVQVQPSATFQPFAVRAVCSFSSATHVFQFNKGEIILVIETISDSWWEGTLGGDAFEFPANSVTRIPVPTTEKLRRDETTHVRAVFSLSASEPGDMTFRGGDVIRLVEAVCADWWRGELDGQIAMFPINYVEALPVPQDTAYNGVYSPSRIATNKNRPPEPRLLDVPQTAAPTSVRALEARLPDVPATREAALNTDMGRLTVKITKATLTYPVGGTWSAHFEVSHPGRKPFYRTALVGLASTVRWDDTFTIDIPSRRFARLDFGLTWIPTGRDGQRAGFNTYRVGEIDLSAMPATWSQTYCFRFQGSTFIFIEYTFLPGVLPSFGPLKLVGGKGPYVDDTQYVREDSA